MTTQWQAFRHSLARGGSRKTRAARFRPGAEGLESRALLAVGLDPTFGLAGVASVPFDNNPAQNVFDSLNFSDFVAQPDGKILVAGTFERSVSSGPPSFDFTETSDLTVARFNADGTLDTTFGSGGRQTVTVLVNGARWDAETFGANGVALTSDNKILVAGTISDPAETNPLADRLAVARLNSNGSIDTSFAGVGYQNVAFDSAVQLRGLAVAPNGKVVLAGDLFASAPPPGLGSNDLAVAQLNGDGSPDTSFDGDGKRTINILTVGGAPSTDTVADVAVGADNKVVIAATVTTVSGVPPTDLSDMAVVRLNLDGSNDASFDGDGIQTIAFDLGGTNRDRATGVAVAADGRVVVVGSANRQAPPAGSFVGRTIDEAAVARLTSAGALDATFDGDGKVTIPATFQGVSFSTRADDVKVGADGSVAVGGSANAPSQFAGMLAKLNSAGVRDATFGTGGVALLPNFGVSKIAPLPNGKVLFFDGNVSRTTAPPPVVTQALATVRGRATGRNRQVSGVTIRFNTTLNPALAGNKLAYAVRAGRGGPAIAVRRVTYDAATSTVTLLFRGSVRTRRPLEVTINSLGIVDADGQVLNGGQPLRVVPEFPVTPARARA